MLSNKWFLLSLLFSSLFIFACNQRPFAESIAFGEGEDRQGVIADDTPRAKLIINEVAPANVSSSDVNSLSGFSAINTINLSNNGLEENIEDNIEDRITNNNEIQDNEEITSVDSAESENNLQTLQGQNSTPEIDQTSYEDTQVTMVAFDFIELYAVKAGSLQGFTVSLYDTTTKGVAEQGGGRVLYTFRDFSVAEGDWIVIYLVKGKYPAYAVNEDSMMLKNISQAYGASSDDAWDIYSNQASYLLTTEFVITINDEMGLAIDAIAASNGDGDISQAGLDFFQMLFDVGSSQEWSFSVSPASLVANQNDYALQREAASMQALLPGWSINREEFKDYNNAADWYLASQTPAMSNISRPTELPLSGQALVLISEVHAKGDSSSGNNDANAIEFVIAEQGSLNGYSLWQKDVLIYQFNTLENYMTGEIIVFYPNRDGENNRVHFFPDPSEQFNLLITGSDMTIRDRHGRTMDYVAWLGNELSDTQRTKVETMVSQGQWTVYDQYVQPSDFVQVSIWPIGQSIQRFPLLPNPNDTNQASDWLMAPQSIGKPNRAKDFLVKSVRVNASNNQLSILFSENPQPEAQDVGRYCISRSDNHCPGISIHEAVLQQNLVTLHTENMQPGVDLFLHLLDIVSEGHEQPLADNVLEFWPYMPPPDLVINEILFDPIDFDSGAEFLELYNRSERSINLAGYRLYGDIYSDEDFFDLPAVDLDPGSFVCIRWATSGNDDYSQKQRLIIFSGHQGIGGLGNSSGWAALFSTQEIVVKNMRDYVQWGSRKNEKFSSMAQQARIWRSESYIPATPQKSIKRALDGQDSNLVEDWVASETKMGTDSINNHCGKAN